MKRDIFSLNIQWWIPDEVYNSNHIQKYISIQNWDLSWYFYLDKFRDIDIDKYFIWKLKKSFDTDHISVLLTSSLVRKTFEEHNIYWYNFDQKKDIIDSEFESLTDGLEWVNLKAIFSNLL